MAKQEVLFEINETQDFYVSKLKDIITGIDNRFEELKEINFGTAMMIAYLNAAIVKKEIMITTQIAMIVFTIAMIATVCRPI